jgi:hypothetical protein
MKRVRAVASRGDRGQAAPATVNHVAFRREGEECLTQARPGCLADQIKRRATAISERPDTALPDLGWVHEQRVQPQTP